MNTNAIFNQNLFSEVDYAQLMNFFMNVNTVSSTIKNRLEQDPQLYLGLNQLAITDYQSLMFLSNLAINQALYDHALYQYNNTVQYVEQPVVQNQEDYVSQHESYETEIPVLGGDESVDTGSALTGYLPTSSEEVISGAEEPSSGPTTVVSSTDETENRRQLLEESMRKTFLSMSESYHGSEAVFVNNRKLYYQGKGRYANNANTLPKEFIKVMNQMVVHEAKWLQHHSELMATFQTLQEEYPGEYPRLNVLTRKWFNDPACETFDYVSDHNAVKKRFTENAEIKAYYGF